VDFFEDAEGGGLMQKGPIPFSVKGESGSWAEPYFACPTLRFESQLPAEIIQGTFG